MSKSAASDLAGFDDDDERGDDSQPSAAGATNQSHDAVSLEGDTKRKSALLSSLGARPKAHSA